MRPDHAALFESAPKVGLDLPGGAAEVSALATRIDPGSMKVAGFVTIPGNIGIMASSDHNGDPAFMIDLIFSDETPEDALRWAAIQGLVDWVKAQARSVSPARWPYVRAMRSSTWEQDSSWKQTWPPREPH